MHSPLSAIHRSAPIATLNSPLIFCNYDRAEAAAVLLAALTDVKPAILATNAMAQYSSVIPLGTKRCAW